MSSKRAAMMLYGLACGLAFGLCVGCSSIPSLATDEQALASGAAKLSSLIKSGAALTIVQAAAKDFLAIDPSSATAQKANAIAQSAKTANDLNALALGLDGTVALIKAAPATPAK
jgi:hypothetical protein